MFNLFKNTPLRREVLQLSIPIVAEQAFTILMGVVNAMMAGHISKEAAAAIGMVDTLNNIFIAIFSSLAIGGTVVVAHYIGQSNEKFANKAAKQAIYAGLLLAVLVSLIAGIFRRPLLGLLYGAAEAEVFQLGLNYFGITLFTYPLMSLTFFASGVLRGAGDTRNPAKVVVIMNITNVIASYLLIFGFAPLGFSGHGVVGAALGIGLARLVGSLLALYILIKGSATLKLRNIWKFQPDFSILGSIFKIGIPASIESLFFNSGKLITQTFVVATGTLAIVTNYVGMSLHSLMMIPGLAFSLAATALVGQNMGRGDSAEAERSLMYLDKLTIFCLMVINISCIPFYPWLCSLYTSNAEIIKDTTFILRLTTLFIPFWSVSFLWPAGMKGAGDVRYTLAVSAVSMWVFRITMGYLLCVYFKLGVIGIWFGMYTDWVIRGIAFYFRYRSQKWKNHQVVKPLEKAV